MSVRRQERREMKTFLPFTRPFACFVGNTRVVDLCCGMRDGRLEREATGTQFRVEEVVDDDSGR